MLASATNGSGGAPIELRPAEIERPRALGYLGGNAFEEPGEEKDLDDTMDEG